MFPVKLVKRAVSYENTVLADDTPPSPPSFPTPVLTLLLNDNRSSGARMPEELQGQRWKYNHKGVAVLTPPFPPPICIEVVLIKADPPPPNNNHGAKC